MVGNVIQINISMNLF